MDSRKSPDLISLLSDYLLVIIISNLSFKDALKTSSLSHRWKYICSGTTNISFKESDFMKSSLAVPYETKRASFVPYIVDWLSNFTGDVIETFELCLYNTFGFETHINQVIKFVVSKKVKNLVLDFSNPFWPIGEVAAAEEADIFQLPDCVYSLKSLESLKLCFCVFDPSRLASPSLLKSVSFYFMRVENIMPMLSRTPLLESLRIKNCWNVGLEAITEYNSRLTRLVFKNCEFSVAYTVLDLPNILIFKLSGNVHYFDFVRVNRQMEEAHLDLREEIEYDDDTGVILCRLLYNLLSAKTLTICHFVIQMIQHGEDPVRLEAPMETTQLMMKTNFLPNEFNGIRLMLNSCPELETLTFHMFPRMSFPIMFPDSAINPYTYWGVEIRYKCLRKTLKFVELWNFSGDMYEMHVLKYLIQHGRVLERVDLYLASGVDESQRISAVFAAEMVRTTFKKDSERLTISLHNG